MKERLANLIDVKSIITIGLTATFVFLAIKGDSSLNKMAVDIIHEVSKTVFEDTNMDSQGLKNVGKFIARRSPKLNLCYLFKIHSLLNCSVFKIKFSPEN